MFKLESRRFLCPLYIQVTLEDQKYSKEASQNHARTRATCSHHPCSFASAKVSEGKFYLKRLLEPPNTTSHMVKDRLRANLHKTKDGKVLLAILKHSRGGGALQN